ncbi:MAG: 50S ribosomal protein L15 [Candidatus Omnitrophota bacterium]
MKTKKTQEKKKESVAVTLYNIKPPKGSHKKRKLLGRGSGSGHGKTSTRGSKGQTSRSGRATYEGHEGGQTPLIRRIPKRGFHSKFKKIYQIVNIVDLKRIKEGEITPEVLQDKGLIRDRSKPVKILSTGEIKHPFKISAHAFSAKAVEKIKAIGGEAKIINA